MYGSVKKCFPHFLWTLLVVSSFYVWMMPSLNAPGPITYTRHDPSSYYHLFSRDLVQQFDEYGYALWWGGHPGLPLQLADCAAHWAKYIYSTGSISNAGYKQYWATRLAESWQLGRSLMYLTSLLILYLSYSFFRNIDNSFFTALFAMLFTLGYLTQIFVGDQTALYFWTTICPDSFAMLFLIPSFISLYYAVDWLQLTGRNSLLFLILSSFLVVSAVFTKLHTMGILLPIALVHISINKIEKKIRLKSIGIYFTTSVLFSIPYIIIMNKKAFFLNWSASASSLQSSFSIHDLFVRLNASYIPFFGGLLFFGIAGMIVFFVQKRYREPIIRSILLYIIFSITINVAFVYMGLTRVHYLLPAIPLLGYTSAYFITFVIERIFGGLPRTLILAKLASFVVILSLITIPEFAKEASYEYELVKTYRQLKIDEIYNKASTLSNEEFILFPEDTGFGVYYLALQASPVMNKRIAPDPARNNPFTLEEVQKIMTGKQIKYIVAPSLGEKVIYTPENWIEIMHAKNENRETKEKFIDG